jgi:hypothetical protein
MWLVVRNTGLDSLGYLKGQFSGFFIVVLGLSNIHNPESPPGTSNTVKNRAFAEAGITLW